MGRRTHVVLGSVVRPWGNSPGLAGFGRPKGSTIWTLMSVFALRCRQCGALVDIPGRFGFKLKNAGIDSTICQSCRQKKFLSDRNDRQNSASVSADQRRRWIPAAALMIAVAVAGTGLILTRQASLEDGPQETTSEGVLSK